ncbi:phosphoribosylaminoimidazolesuccinocarboxamide synthase [Candidatus Saccharibacteria bacterium]|nr:MAG: phosphoribosylaminoimidazolesuccinocarboxamide synthase [Candidatus Saccharibacteria bacterium]
MITREPFWKEVLGFARKTAINWLNALRQKRYTSSMNTAILQETKLDLPDEKAVYHGKVRDVYDFGDRLMLVATDRYSAFDRVLATVPHKGALLTQTSRWWFEQTTSIVPNHIISYPDPNVAYCRKYDVIPLETVVRGYITGVTNTSLWHTYSGGQRDYGTFVLPDGLKKNDKLPEPVLTPTTKFETHDRNLTPAEAVATGLLDRDVWERVSRIALELFRFGQQKAEAAGLLLVDTKYEFGLTPEGEVVLIDELHTQDSSRYWLRESYAERLAAGEEPENYDKEFLRLWFKARFDPYAQDSEAPVVPDDVIAELERRYRFVYERLTGTDFQPPDTTNIEKRIETNVKKMLLEQR